MKTLDEFKKAGGVLEGNRSHTHEEYEGAPRPYNEKLKTTIENVLPGHHGHHNTAGTTGTTGVGSTGTGLGHSGMHNTSSGLTDSSRPDSGYGGNNYNKPSMGDKLNPRVDADRDGKAGIMD